MLAAMNGPHHPLPGDYFDRVREKLREQSKSKAGLRAFDGGFTFDLAAPEFA